MPVEIKELIIRMNIVNEHSQQPASQISQKQMKDLTDQCVHEVLKIMEKKNER